MIFEKLFKKRKKSHYEKLAKKIIRRHAKLQKDLLKKHTELVDWVSQNSKQVAIGSLGSIILISSGSNIPSKLSQAQAIQEQVIKDVSRQAVLVSDLSLVLPNDVRPLTNDEEIQVANMLSNHFGISVMPEINGIRLNRTYGIIGAEQHLARYPGDNMGTHFETLEESEKYYSSGMAPGLGAWRYFTTNGVLTQEDKDREKYYIAVQTFLAPGYNEHVAEYNNFFKYRKMLVVNPENGKAIIADIGDAGPAEFTGKHLGGSPEVMDYLGREDGAKKGPVLYFFINDPGEKVPLGPIGEL